MPPVTPPVPPDRRSWRRWVVVAVALLVGVGIGAGIGIAAGSSNPKQSKEYRSLAASLSAAQNSEEAAKESALAAVRSADASVATREGELEQSQAAVESSAAALSASAASLASQAQVVQQNTITEGTWTVGSDVQPGTYRTTAPVTEGCYWEITKSGSNGGDIVENDLPTGGYPTVTLSAGQDFTTQGCGDWLKQ